MHTRTVRIKQCGHLFCSEHLPELRSATDEKRHCPNICCEVKFDAHADSADLEDFPDQKPIFAAEWRDIIHSDDFEDGALRRLFVEPILEEHMPRVIASEIASFVWSDSDGSQLKSRIVRRRINKAKGSHAREGEQDKQQVEDDEVCEEVSWPYADDTRRGYEHRFICEVGADEFPFTFIPSAKMTVMMKKIQQIGATHPGDKILVYSQWTSMLRLIGFVLQKYGVGYVRYDGSHGHEERKRILSDFRNKDAAECRVLLVSLKCGALGLNLISANRVIFVDLWWNPAVEAQAVDRVHRIGQDKHVYISRIVMRETIEDRMLQIQREKQGVADFALTGAKMLKSNSRESIRILRRLFGVGQLLELRLERIGRVEVHPALARVEVGAVLREELACLYKEARHIPRASRQISVVDERHIEHLGDPSQLRLQLHDVLVAARPRQVPKFHPCCCLVCELMVSPST